MVTRRTERMCRSDLLLPDYDLRLSQPLSQPVAITFVTPAGAFAAACPRRRGTKTGPPRSLLRR